MRQLISLERCWQGGRDLGLVKMVKAPDTEADGDLTTKGARDVGWTEVGLFLLITSIIPTIIFGLFWLNRYFDYFPILGYLGFFWFIAGSSFIVLGRKSFGAKHSNYAIFLHLRHSHR
ncbi:MAG: hypothetical protein AUG17_08170 [Crenarchaeota archaeon 13_1_20CM_2_53_14]|nr:MAG: hypothetical protein AUG17_08170 [Crenarchaeota archaeon 13_1_20CM_2_53_14]